MLLFFLGWCIAVVSFLNRLRRGEWRDLLGPGLLATGVVVVLWLLGSGLTLERLLEGGGSVWPFALAGSVVVRDLVRGAGRGKSAQ